jgi:hypothetical protein
MSDSEDDGFNFTLNRNTTNPRREREEPNEPESESENAEPTSDAEAPAVPAADSVDSALEKRKIITLIRAYKLKFTEKCAHIETDGLQDKSKEELEEIVRDARFAVSHGSTGQMVHMAADLGVRVWERMCNDILGLGIYGLPVYLKRDQNWNDLITEWELLHAEYTEIPVEYRIGLALVQATYQLYALKEAMNQPDAPANNSIVPQQLQDRWASL